MSWLAPFVLRLLHLIYSSVLSISALKNILLSPTRRANASSRRIPKHMAVILRAEPNNSTKDVEIAYLESVSKAVNWCRQQAVEKLTVYDSQGVIAKRSEDLRRLLMPSQDSSSESSESEIEYPLTPPLSDYSDSRPISPEFSVDVGNLAVQTLHLGGTNGRRTKPTRRKSVMTKLRPLRTLSECFSKGLMLHILSRESSKPALASVARSLSYQHARIKEGIFELPVEVLGTILEGQNGLSSPDLMVVHNVSRKSLLQTPLELHGFPPWQIRLTEIHHTQGGWTPSASVRGDCAPLEERHFIDAMEEYNKAEMRLGK